MNVPAEILLQDTVPLKRRILSQLAFKHWRWGPPCIAVTVELQMSKRWGRHRATRRSTTSSREMARVPLEALRQAA